MSLSRIPGIAQLASFTSLSLQSNPTLRRYNDVLAQAFYHHGRLCASNQATVMVLVIVSVFMISYPGVVTIYNSSIYARQWSASNALSGNLSLSSWATTEHPAPSTRRRRNRPDSFEGDLDTFWTNKVIAPTWTQDPDVFSRNLPSPHPLHFIAPIVINATDLLTPAISSEDSGASSTPPSGSISKTQLLEYASKVQRRIETIVVDYSTEDTAYLGMNRGIWATRDHQKAPRLVSLRDVCVLAPPRPQKPWEKSATENRYSDDQLWCLVHTSHIRDPQRSSPFGDITFDEEQKQAALVISFFLRGDLDGSAPWSNHQRHHSRSQESTIEDKDLPKDTLDVKRVWHLIFSKLASELQQERVQKNLLRNSQGLSDLLSTADDDSILSDGRDPDTTHSLGQIGLEREDETMRLPSGPGLLDGFDIPFTVSVIPPAEAPQRVSRRLVTEESAQIHTNMSLEYWLLATAYFVMFLYISLSVGKVDLVKSKYGLGIAAVATVFVSLLMSIGICSVFGVTLTLMPWEILPFMIIVVGVENINILVHAVVETPMDLPVKERVGRGLGTVGVSITLTLVAELGLLAIGAMTTIPAVQEFCTFAIAAVLMDYLLQMTFFITVISIDIRRLELSDLSTRPTTPYSRYPSSARHVPLKSGHLCSGIEGTRYGGGHAVGGFYTYEEERIHHRRNDSSASQYSDGESKSGEKRAKPNRKVRTFTSLLMVGVMAYLGYIYGTTTQPVAGEQEPIMVSYWRILSTETASEFWSVLDPSHTGGYIEIKAPVVVALTNPSNISYHTDCYSSMYGTQIDECEDEQDGTSTSHTRQGIDKAATSESLLDPKRPFKLLRGAFVFICLFAFWLVRVIVIPSIVLAAAILLLLSYLLSPQRKLLVDLQWRFPFIVLPGDYQSKRRLMMEELLAQEAREREQELGSSTPLPGSVETLQQGGHKADIDQMDASADGHLILTSSLDGVILLWNGSPGSEQRTPLARLEDGTQSTRSTSLKVPKSRPVKFLKLDPTGEIAIASFGDGSVHVWNLGPFWGHFENLGSGQILRIQSGLEFVRGHESTADVSKLRASSVCFWNPPMPEGAGFLTKSNPFLLVGYRDGQVWQWDLVKGEGRCTMETKHRGGVTEMATIELDLRTRQDLKLRRKAYVVTAGKDGSIQCWSVIKSKPDLQETWSLLWSHSGLGAGIGVSVLSLNTEVPMVAVGYSNGAIKVWDLEQGIIVWTLSRGLMPSTGQPRSSPIGHLDRRFSHGHVDNLPHSHQGAITKLFFHALEVEITSTGESGPRVWLVISSGMDEKVMVWMVEWEGLMCIPTLPHHGSRSESDLPAVGQVNAAYGLQPTISSINSQISAPGHDRKARLTRSPSFGPNGFMNDAGNIEYLGMLTSSLPAPRLIGFMKQRGGKSITVSGCCLYGVRRTESSSTFMGDRVGPRKPSHASALDTAAPGSSNARSRRKSDSHGLTYSQTGTQEQATQSSGTSKRGWELWEADLSQCGIFSDNGIATLNLSIRTLDLQPPPQERSRGFIVQGAEMGMGRPSVTKAMESPGPMESIPPIMITTNGSSIAVQASAGSDTMRHSNHEARPMLQRKHGSYVHQIGHRGYVSSTGFTKATQFTSTTPVEYGYVPYSTSSEDEGAPVLLPFVETKLVLGLTRRLGIQPLSYSAEGLLEREPDVKDIVIGFGNFIKIVRLEDEGENEEASG
ncbi:hypothetical protein BGX34_008114 [Mortierella sp. NVP85]|nr:hypothetical protein BGX34_008114 [Mortierella sp. NVP85]